MWVHRLDPPEAEEGVGRDRRGGPGEQAPEGPGAVPGQPEGLGELADQHVHVDEQLSEWHHPPRDLRAEKKLDAPSLPPGVAPVQLTSRA